MRQPNPAHVQQLPERCYALTVKHPFMVAATADRNLIVFNLQNPQVLLLIFCGIIQIIGKILVVASNALNAEEYNFTSLKKRENFS